MSRTSPKRGAQRAPRPGVAASQPAARSAESEEPVELSPSKECSSSHRIERSKAIVKGGTLTTNRFVEAGVRAIMTQF